MQKGQANDPIRYYRGRVADWLKKRIWGLVDIPEADKMLMVDVFSILCAMGKGDTQSGCEVIKFTSCDALTDLKLVLND